MAETSLFCSRVITAVVYSARMTDPARLVTFAGGLVLPLHVVALWFRLEAQGLRFVIEDRATLAVSGDLSDADADAIERAKFLLAIALTCLPRVQ